MGDGGVACVPLQHIMDKILISDTLCSGKVGNFNPKMKSKLKSGKEVENGEEVEEGEFGSLVENGEFVQLVKPRKLEIKSEIEKGEFVVDKWRKGKVEKDDEFASGKWRKGDSEKGEFSSGRLWSDEGNGAEKGEFISDRWGKTEDISYSKMRRHDSPRDKGWKSGKYFGEKEFTRAGSQQMKRSARWETNPRFGSNFEEEDGYLKNEPRNGKSHGRNYSSGNRLKRHGTDSDNWDRDSDRDRDRDRDRKHQGEFGEYTNSKSRRISDEYPEERSNKYSFPSRNISSDRYFSRPHESSLSSRVVHDKYNNSPRHSERSPRDRARYDDYQDQSPLRRDRSPYDWGRDRSPYDWGRDRSPYDRSRNYDHRNRSPSHSDRSPQDQARYQDRRDRTPNFLEPSPLKRGRPINRETNRKSGANEKHQSHHERKGQEEKFNQREANERDPICSANEPEPELEDRRSLDNEPIDPENNANHQPLKEDQSSSPRSDCKESPQVNGPTEEMLSMEVDMDICDTPPHVPIVANSTNGKWFYLDHIGVEQGPSRLCDLKVLVEEGFLVSDHLVKHLDSDRWVTVENAVSPIVTANFPSIVSDAVTELVNPPEAPGNLLADNGDVQSGDQIGEEILATSPEPVGDNFAASETFHIDERVGTLLEGFAITPGNELEAVGEVLQMTFDHGEWEQWYNFEGFIIHQPCTGDRHDQRAGEEFPTHSDFESKETFDTDWFPGGWSCKGGDWKRNDEDFQDKSKRKSVINDGYPLCQMPKSGHEDPRWHRKDELYYPSHSRRLDLPSWAFSSQEDSGDCKTKPLGIRGVKGTMLPVIRINTCVVKDHGSFISEPRVKVRGKERHSSRSTRPYSANSDAKRSSEEGSSYSKKMHQHDSHDSWKSVTSISIPKDRLCTADDLQLHLGDWYYLDGVGHEQGPLLYPELQVLADQGIIQKHTSVFRKFDKVWVPVTSAAEASEPAGKIQGENNALTSTVSSSFHSLHPQFIGYARGKLHELVMKSYKSREFAAAINEVLDPWINARQPRNEIEKHIYNPAANNRSDHFRAGKKARLLVDGSEEEYDMEEDVPTIQKDEYSFDDLCGDTTFCKEDNTGSETEAGIWDQLDGNVLARVFHYLRADLKSLVYAALTCKHWRSVVKFYKDISRQADFSSVAHNCTDSMILNIVNGYNKEKITSLVLLGCANITPVILEEIIRLLPSLSCIDIRGLHQFEDLSCKFPSINWVKSRGLHSKVRSLTPITGRTSSVFKTYNGLDSKADDSSGLRDYLESLDKRDTNQLFRRSLYKRSKLFDAKRSSSILSRSAHLRHLSFKNSRTGYKRMEEFLSSSLKDIMKENTFGFFVPKVAQIEDRMKNGYYAGHGLSSIKEDISRMCRAAIKAKNRGDAGDMNHIITLFIRLAMSLEGISKSSHERDEMTKTWKENSPPGFGSSFSRYKRLNKVTEKKYTSRSNGSFGNGGSDYRDYASDREIRRHLSKLNKNSMDSESEASDRSSEETQTDSPSTSSDTDSDSDSQRRDGAPESRGDAYFTADDGLDSQADNREWGARMTKASLVPPVTRKYEVIDHYVVVADEEEVQRKMRVSLPEDYAEKLNSQKNGTEESDMEIPEVKDYKPRKQLGDEVIEQEVYGIDPYTHNLLLDSMPGESDWSLLDKHLFIEDVLLPSLNRQVRDFTGTGNTPMMYHLRPVIEGIIKTAEEDHDTRTVKLCQFILNTIDSRPEDSYVAYRKGLGVVCNKEGGFGDDDFVVEFLGEVYPAWKWFEKQDGIRYLQKNSKEPAPEFYNIYLERPKGDADGYDLVVVDAMHKANYASRICHSCRPNCEAKVTAVDGQYQIGIYTVRPIGYGEEVTFDYNSVTESKEEYEASVCLCGSQVCRGSYLNLTGDGAFQKVLRECHGILDRHHLMLEACEFDSVSDEDYIDLGRAGLGSCLLGGLPQWLIAYSSRLVRFINFERTKLPDEILRHNLEEKRKYFADICLDVERNDAEVQAEGVYNQRLQNLALTLDKVRYVMRCVFDDPREAPPPLEKLTPEEAVSFIWKGDGSLVDELIQCMAPHMEDTMLNDLKSNIRAHDPSGSGDIQRELRKSLLWLRDEVRNLPCTYKCRHDAAADLIHIYAYTKYFFRIREYKPVTSPPVYISPLDLGPKYSEKLGSGFHEYSKTYGENYCLGQLIYWHNQTNGEPDCSLARASKGCLSLPDFGSFYAKVQKPSRQRVYGPRTVKFMLAKMEKQPQRPWPRDRIWSFESSPKVFGSPMLDAVLRKAPLDKEMVHWLKHRPPIFQAMWDR